jgi:hypothetical protein
MAMGPQAMPPVVISKVTQLAQLLGNSAQQRVAIGQFRQSSARSPRMTSTQALTAAEA